MDRKSKYLLFALPSFILIFTVMLFPVGYAIIYSFTDFRLGKSAKFIGLENYISIFRISQRPGLYTYTYFSCGIKSVCNRNDISITFG